MSPIQNRKEIINRTHTYTECPLQGGWCQPSNRFILGYKFAKIWVEPNLLSALSLQALLNGCKFVLHCWANSAGWLLANVFKQLKQCSTYQKLNKSCSMLVFSFDEHVKIFCAVQLAQVCPLLPFLMFCKQKSQYIITYYYNKSMNA